MARHLSASKKGKSRLITFLTNTFFSIILWFVLLVTGSVSGMISMTGLNVRPRKMPHFPTPMSSTTSQTTLTNTTDLSTALNTATTSTLTTAPRKKAVLIMSTKAELNVPIITALDGRVVHADFAYGASTEVYESCLVVFNGYAFIFGGSIETRQISRVDNCELSRVGSLDFDFKNGACATLMSSIYLCFRAENSKSCKKGRAPLGNFSSIAESSFKHKYIRIAASRSKFI